MDVTDPRRKRLKSARTELTRLLSRDIRLRGARPSLCDVMDLVNEALDERDIETSIVDETLAKLHRVDRQDELRGETKRLLNNVIRYVEQAARWHPPQIVAVASPAVRPDPSPVDLAERRKSRRAGLVKTALLAGSPIVAAWIGLEHYAASPDPVTPNRQEQVHPAPDLDKAQRTSTVPAALAN